MSCLKIHSYILCSNVSTTFTQDTLELLPDIAISCILSWTFVRKNTDCPLYMLQLQLLLKPTRILFAVGLTLNVQARQRMVKFKTYTCACVIYKTCNYSDNRNSTERDRKGGWERRSESETRKLILWLLEGQTRQKRIESGWARRMDGVRKGSCRRVRRLFTWIHTLYKLVLLVVRYTNIKVNKRTNIKHTVCAVSSFARIQ